ncbi:hypothetical protein SPRG_00416 [Saprolegnia parasitica CBS 223.65]|uniref:Bulb-type lectin domain-containing protein n=1 Tax=Saprolegnia parasitica (strain CBS 223.65) TaxID=695850 RepID=A0A067CXZ1_SAPPC|nr:hypothetical protein SPRG_00416 [Saprolegnia parasitica CBS 223.65]KDO35574.1 hypothetical protein SPRG_00416 [Saprolegnia parasitica CBS 223.65]|eukprot:XP_012193905.1 hypothetical protein SPRG_00416 [Saprolegnia parasitica CBS 223.65]
MKISALLACAALSLAPTAYAACCAVCTSQVAASICSNSDKTNRVARFPTNWTVPYPFQLVSRTLSHVANFSTTGDFRVINRATNKVTWSANSGYSDVADAEYAGQVLQILNTGQVVVYDVNEDIASWIPDMFPVDQKDFCAIMQDDGNFVIYDPGCRPVWASNTYGK